MLGLRLEPPCEGPLALRAFLAAEGQPGDMPTPIRPSVVGSAVTGQSPSASPASPGRTVAAADVATPSAAAEAAALQECKRVIAEQAAAKLAAASCTSALRMAAEEPEELAGAPQAAAPRCTATGRLAPTQTASFGWLGSKARSEQVAGADREKMRIAVPLVVAAGVVVTAAIVVALRARRR